MHNKTTNIKLSDWLARELPLTDVPELPLWSENYCFEGVSPANKIGFFCHNSRQDFNHNVWRDTFILYLGGEQVVVWKGYGQNTQNNTIGGAQLHFTCIEARKIWSIEFNGAAQKLPAQAMAPDSNSAVADGSFSAIHFKVTLTADAPVWDLGAVVSGHAWAKDHYQQSMVFNGEVHIDGKTHTLNGVCTRDHSRGPRDWSGLGPHAWIHGGFAGGRRFIVLALDGKPDPLHQQVRTAIITEGNKAYKAEVVSVEMIQSLHNGGGLQHTIKLQGPHGLETIEAQQWQIATLALAPPNQLILGAPNDASIVSHSCISPTEFRWNGELCYGITERSHPT